MEKGMGSKTPKASTRMGGGLFDWFGTGRKFEKEGGGALALSKKKKGIGDKGL